MLHAAGPLQPDDINRQAKAAAKQYGHADTKAQKDSLLHDLTDAPIRHRKKRKDKKNRKERNYATHLRFSS